MELVVTITNDGTAVTEEIPVKIQLPATLAVIRESHEGMTLRGERDGTYEYATRRLNPGERVIARFPFRRDGERALIGGEVHVVAGTTEFRRSL